RVHDRQLRVRRAGERGRDHRRGVGGGGHRRHERERRNQHQEHRDRRQLPEGLRRVHRREGRPHVRSDDWRAEVRVQSRQEVSHRVARARGTRPRCAVLRFPAMSRPTVLRAALLAVAATALAAIAHAQIVRRQPAAAWTPDSAVKAVLTGGSAQLTPDPPIDTSIPRIWLTKAERTGWKQTSDYEEMMRNIRSLEAGSRWVKLEIIGRTGQGRELPLLIVSKDRAFTPEAGRALGKPIVLIQNGIHAGEIEGKDASGMLLRDIAVLHKYDALMDSVILLVLPVFSVDASERRSHFNRINQNGPDEMGWRHTPIGLNLNRDYMKLDAPEMRALIGNVYTKWWPDLLIDNHTTDGADYRWDVTWATNHGAGMPAALDRWVSESLERGAMVKLAG